MPIPNEMPMNDAPTTTMAEGNPYCFIANKAIDGWYDKDNNKFKGSLESNTDEDWILIELQGGQGYTIKVDGSDRAGDAAGDTILTILDSKGGTTELPVMNDDIDGISRSSAGPQFAENEVTFYNQDSGTYYISVKAYNRHPSLDNSGDYTITVEPIDLPGDIVGGPGNDKLQGTGANETIVGKGGHDVLLGGGGDDNLDGGDGDDLLEGGPGEDVLTGGKGKDTISYLYSAMMPATGEGPDPEQKVTINLNAQLALGGDADGDEFGNDIENVQGAMFAENALTGDRRDNKLWGGMFADVLIGESGDDSLYGMGGVDELEGGRGDDLLVGGAHGDSLIGGAGDDTASYAGSDMPVTVRLHARQAMGGHAEGDMFDDMVTVEYDVFGDEDDEDRVTGRDSESVPDIENLTGSGHDDILAGDSRDNVIRGGRGHDKIYGGPHGGNDELYGDAGDDHIFGGRGDDELHGGAGNDMLFGGKGADIFMGGAGNDKIFADNDDTEINGWLKDQAMTEAEADPGNSDTVSYERLGPRMSVTATLSAGNIMNVENIIGSQGRDTLTGDAGANVIEGHDGGDTLNGGGDGTATDGSGAAMADTLSYEHSDRGVSVTLRRTAVTSEFGADTRPLTSGGHASGDQFPDTGNGNTFQHIIGSDHDDDLTGDFNDNMLWGGPDDDRLIGGRGDDTLEGGPGSDELDGGGPGGEGTAAQNVTSDARLNAVLGADNNDTLSYKSSTEAVNINLGALSFTGGDADGDEIETFDWYHDDENDTDPIELSTFENVTGSANDDRLTGDVRKNILKGLAGRDHLRGGAEEDTLMSGGGGTEDNPEIVDGGNSRFNHDLDSSLDTTALNTDDTDGTGTPDVQHMDTADYSAMTAMMGGIVVDLNDNTVSKGTNGANGVDRLVNIERIEGSGGNDKFIVSDDEDDNFIIDGGAGSDTLSFEFAADHPVKLELLSLVGADGTAGTADDIHIAHVPNDGTNDGDLQGANVFYNETAANDPTAAPTLGALYDLQTVEDTAPSQGGNQSGIHRAWGIENITGTDFDDVIRGVGDQANTFKGGAGDDTLAGGAGDDTLEGGSGNDELDGGDGSDMLMGGAGRDRLEGGAGIDLLRGDAGDDILEGGTGDVPDVFLFCVKDGRNVDTIEDFQLDIGGTVGETDKIDLRDFDIPNGSPELAAEALAAIISISTDDTNGATGKIIINLDDYGGGRIVIDNQTLSNWDKDSDGEIDKSEVMVLGIDIAGRPAEGNRTYSIDKNEDGMIFGEGELWNDANDNDTYDTGEANDGIFII